MDLYCTATGDRPVPKGNLAACTEGQVLVQRFPANKRRILLRPFDDLVTLYK